MIECHWPENCRRPAVGFRLFHYWRFAITAQWLPVCLEHEPAELELAA